MLGFGPRLDNQPANDQSSECAKASVGRQIDREPRRLRSDRGEDPPNEPAAVPQPAPREEVRTEPNGDLLEVDSGERGRFSRSDGDQ